MAESLRAMSNKETSTGTAVQFRRREAGHRTLMTQGVLVRYHCPLSGTGEYHEIYMNIRTLKTELDPGPWIVDVPFQTSLVVWLAKLIFFAFFRFGGQVY